MIDLQLLSFGISAFPRSIPNLELVICLWLELIILCYIWSFNRCDKGFVGIMKVWRTSRKTLQISDILSNFPRKEQTLKIPLEVSQAKRMTLESGLFPNVATSLCFRILHSFFLNLNERQIQTNFLVK